MTQEEKHSIALMRYAAITPLVNGTLDGYQSKSSFYREAALKSYPADDGSMRQFSPASIQRWYHSYLKSGFDGLMPKGRTDSGKSRVLDDACQEYIRHVKTQYPRIPAAAIYRQMLSDGICTRNSVSESSVNRFVNHIMEENKLSDHKDMRRYERPHINEVWCGGSSVGPGFYHRDPKRRFLSSLLLTMPAVLSPGQMYFLMTLL